MAWEVFKPERNTIGEPAVTFSPSGRLTFNKAATSILQSKAHKAELLWDVTRSLVGVRPSKEPDATYKLRASANLSSTSLSCIAFLNHIGYDWSKPRSFRATWDQKRGMFVIALPREHLGHKPLKRRDVLASRYEESTLEEKNDQRAAEATLQSLDLKL